MTNHADPLTHVLVPANKLTIGDCYRFGLDVDAVRAMGAGVVDDSQPVEREAYPFPLETESGCGWAISFKYLESIRERIEDSEFCPSLEGIEAALLAAFPLSAEDSHSFPWPEAYPPNDAHQTLGQKLNAKEYDRLKFYREVAASQQAKVQEPLWYAVMSKEAPVINKAIRREDVAQEYADKCRETYSGVEIIPLFAAPLQSDTHPGSDPVSRPGSRDHFRDATKMMQAEAQSKEPTMSLLCRHSKGYTCEFCNYPTKSKEGGG